MSADKTFEAAVARAVAALERLKPVTRAKLAEKCAELARVAAERFAEVRSGALVELREDGWSLADMKAEFGIARARLSQLINREDYRAGRRARGRR